MLQPVSAELAQCAVATAYTSLWLRFGPRARKSFRARRQMSLERKC